MSDSAQWYLHVQGETLGPLNTDTVLVMLKQNRLQFADFIWSEGLTKWVRILDLDEFAAVLPGYPKVPIPSRGTPKSAVVTQQFDLPKPAKPKPVAAPSVNIPRPKRELPREWPKIRRFPRVAIKAMVIIPEKGKFEAFDISEGGIFLRSSDPLLVGTEIKFMIESKAFERPLEMTGLVIRLATTSNDSGFAIEFTRVNPAHRRILRQYVEQNNESSNSQSDS